MSMSTILIPHYFPLNSNSFRYVRAMHNTYNQPYNTPIYVYSVPRTFPYRLYEEENCEHLSSLSFLRFLALYNSIDTECSYNVLSLIQTSTTARTHTTRGNFLTL